MPELLDFTADEQSILEKTKELPNNVAHRFAGISKIDHQLGLVRKKLEETGKADNTVIIFMSDHNIEPGKATSYEKGIHIPMIVYLPHKDQGGKVSKSLVQSVDLYPTLMELAGTKVKENLKLDGISFLPLLSDATANSREFIFSENGFTRSATDGRYKYIALRYPNTLIDSMQSGKIDFAPSYVQNWPQAHSAIAMSCFPAYFDQNQFYDLSMDPFEQQNIYDKSNPEVIKLQAALAEHLKDFEHPFDLQDIEYLESGDFKKHYQKNLKYDLANISWFKRDHGAFQWPPLN